MWTGIHPRLGGLGLIVALLLAAGCARSLVSENPYDGVDWDGHRQHHGSFHNHTTESDGRMSPAAVIDHYHAEGFDVLAITDHNKATWPWSRFDRDPAALDMVAVPGNELSRHHHTLSLFTDLETGTRDHETAIRQVREADGIAVLAHPGRYWDLEDGRVPDAVRDRYVRLFNTYDHLIGMEAVNQTDRYPEDRALWDAVLTEMMPARPVWGMANDDSHVEPHIGLNTTVLLLPEFTRDAVREALASGRFYFTTVTSHPPDERDPQGVPRINRIVHDPGAGVIRIDAEVAGRPLDDERVRWISAGGRVVHHGASIDLTQADGIERYVRAELRGPGGTAYTQPFALQPR